MAANGNVNILAIADIVLDAIYGSIEFDEETFVDVEFYADVLGYEMNEDVMDEVFNVVSQDVSDGGLEAHQGRPYIISVVR